jgi:hypothetical protein
MTRRNDQGRKIRARKCVFCSAPPGAQHDSNCIFGENGRLPTQGARRYQDTGLVVSDVDSGRVAAIADGTDIIICSPRDAEALVKVVGDGPLIDLGHRRIQETLESARRRDEWNQIR